MAVIQRDLVESEKVLSTWLAGRWPGATDIKIDNMSVPSIGFSGEILLFDASWSLRGEAVKAGMALRIEPTEYQIFLNPLFEEQYRVQAALGATDVPVAQTIAFEEDTTILGGRFYATERRPGQPYDVQVNPNSWVHLLTVEEQRRLYDNFLDVLARIHQLDPYKLGLDFLEQPQRGEHPLDQQINYYREYYDWASVAGRNPIIEAGLDWVERNRPAANPPVGLLWGDARLGNQLWDEEQRCTAVLDWEMCALGPAEEDFAWFIFQDQATPASEGTDARVSSMGTIVPPGFSNIDETVKAYEERLGRPLYDLDFYLMWAAVRTAIIIHRLTPLVQNLGVSGLPNVGENAIADWLGRSA